MHINTPAPVEPQIAPPPPKFIYHPKDSRGPVILNLHIDLLRETRTSGSGLSYLTTTSFTLGSVDKASNLIVLFYKFKFFIFVKD
jgi:hypothetical protein